MTPLLDVAVRSSLPLLGGLALHELLRNRAAALRHWVLAAAIAGAAAVGPLSLVLPAWRLPLPQPRVTPHVTTAISGERTVREPGAIVATSTRAGLIPILWLAGVAAGALPFAIGLWRLSRVTARARHVHDNQWTRVTEELSASYGLRRRVVILQTDTPDLLATWGVMAPRVLLPLGADEWDEDRVRAVLCHELAHIRRFDWIVQTCAEALRTLYWFNPLIWIACTRLRRDSERACDDAVLDAGIPAPTYASHLLELARICRGRAVAWTSALLVARPSTLERRIAAMLNGNLDRRTLSARAMALTAAALAAVTLPIAAYHAEQTSPLPLRGTVYDATGAVMPAVELTLSDPRIEDAQRAKTVVTSDASGRFQFASVTPGRYMLEASLPGFRPLRQEVTLANTRDWDRAITLEVGALQETIEVRASRGGQPQKAGRPALRVGGAIRPPSKLVDKNPVYPESMRAAGLEGTVPLEATIARDGSVGSVRVLTAQVHPDFALAAADAVRKWRFDPTLLNGEPVEVVMTVTVTFSLSN